MMEIERRRFSRNTVIVGVLALASAGAGCIAGHRNLVAAVQGVMESCRAAGPWVYFGAMAILPIVGFSLFAFVASAGALFAPSMGIGPVIACGLGALAVNVSLSYVLARGALRPCALRIVRHFGGALPDIRRYGPWEVALLMRLLPGPPFGLQSCLLGLAQIPFGIYLVTSLAIPALYFSGMVCLSSGALVRNPWAAAAAGIALGIVGFAVHRLRLRLTRQWNGLAGARREAG